MHTPLYLGIDIGGSSVKVGVVDDNGVVQARSRVALDPAAGLAAGLDLIFAAVDELWDEGCARSSVHCVGIASPGTMDIDAGIVFHPYNLPGWEDLPLRDIVQDRLNLPAVLQNDANAAAYGEYWVGAASHASSLLFWTLGTGVGGGIIINGELIEGAHSHGGECGHMIIQMEGGRRSPFGMHGSLECYAGGKALVQRCHEALAAGRTSLIRELASQAESITPCMVGHAAERGDQLAGELIAETARYLGIGTASLMNVLNPEMVLIGGAMTFGGWSSPVGRKFLESVRQTSRTYAFPIPGERTLIDFATLGNDAGFIGAAGWARSKLSLLSTSEHAEEAHSLSGGHTRRKRTRRRIGA